MAVPDSNDASNKFDVSGDNGLWIDPHGRDADKGGRDGVVALDGSPAPRPGFEGQGSDANHRKSIRNSSRGIPPTIG